MHGATEAGAAQLVHLGSALQGLNIEEAAIKACLVRAGIVHNAAMNLPAAVANSLLGKDARKAEAESSAAVTAFTATFAALQSRNVRAREVRSARQGFVGRFSDAGRCRQQTCTGHGGSEHAHTVVKVACVGGGRRQSGPQ